MKETEKTRWVKIPLRKGYRRYSMRSSGQIKKIQGAEIIVPFNDYGVKKVYLKTRTGKFETFRVDDLLKITFPKKNRYGKYTTESVCFSTDEEDYGLGVNKSHWRNLKKEINRIKYKEKM